MHHCENDRRRPKTSNKLSQWEEKWHPYVLCPSLHIINDWTIWRVRMEWKSMIRRLTMQVKRREKDWLWQFMVKRKGVTCKCVCNRIGEGILFESICHFPVIHCWNVLKQREKNFPASRFFSSLHVLIENDTTRKMIRANDSGNGK